MGRYIRKGQCNRCGWCCSNEDCEYFISADDTEDGKAICLIHDKERPFKCTDFPSAPPIIHDKCGYWFYDTVTHKNLGYKEV